MSLAAANQWVALIALLLSIANLLWAWISRPARDLSARIKETADGAGQRIDALSAEMNARGDRHRENLKDHDRRIQRVEDQIPHLPTREDLHELGRTLTALQTQMSGMTATVTRIDDFLRNRP